MEKTFTKIMLTLFIVSFLGWVGMKTMRNVNAARMFDIHTMSFLESMDPEIEKGIDQNIVRYSLDAMALYPLVLVAGSVYLWQTNRTFKQSGWLLMSVILFGVFIPVEVYCIVLDFRMANVATGGHWMAGDFRAMLIHRETSLAGLPFIALLSYYTIIGLFIFRPMERNN